MSETVQQYIERLSGYVGDRDPWSILMETPGHLRRLIGSATPNQLSWKPSPERWSVTQIVAHLVDAEIVGAWRFRSVLAEDGIRLQAYDQSVWASAFQYENTDAHTSVALFEALRASTLGTLQRVDPSRLEHAGMHDERGRESITHLVRMYAGHDLNHGRQIERLLEAAKP
jgi:DinB superfamily